MPAWKRCLLAAVVPLAGLGSARSCASSALALDPARPLKQLSIDNWTSADGLPQNSVYAISQTDDGYVWLGTQEGLVRFDGVRFHVFDPANTPAFTTPHVTALLHGRDGALWIGTESGHLVRHAEGSFEAYRPMQGGSAPSVTALAELHGRLWVGTAEGLAEWRDGRLVPVAQGGPPSAAVRALYADRSGSLWIGTDHGLSREGAPTLTSRDGLASDRVTAITEDAEGDLWVGTRQGLSRRHPDGFVTYTRRDGLPADWVRGLAVDRQGAVWIATERGVARFWKGRFDSLTDGEGLNRISLATVFEGADGSLWIGMNGGGLGRLQAGPILTYSSRHGLEDEAIYALTGDGGAGLWVGTIRGGVQHFLDGRFAAPPVTNPFAASATRSVHYDPQYGLWVGSDLGLYRYDRDGRLTACPPEQGFPQSTVRAIVKDGEGTVWFGTEGDGLVGWNHGRFVRYGVADGLPSDRVRTLALARGGGLWVGTYGGVARLKDGRFRSYTTADGLSSALVRGLYEDEGGALWIGTAGGGLNRLHHGRVSVFRRRDGLFSDVVYEILEDGEGHLWMSCNKGFFRVVKQELEAMAEGRAADVRSVVFDESAGMLSRECNSGSAAGWKTADGHLWFPTLKGLVRADPRTLSAPPAPPPAILEQALVDDVAVDHRRMIWLAPGRHRLQLSYTAPAFLHARGLRFRVRLDGFDAAWREAGTRREAFYTNVPPGQYTFRVVALGADGVSAGPEAAFSFGVRPHFHQTAAFVVLCVVAALAAFGGVYALRVRALKRRERLLAVRVDEALANIKTLSGLLPICAWCHKVRDDTGYWNQLEQYVREHSAAEFSHGICPECSAAHFPGLSPPADPGPH